VRGDPRWPAVANPDATCKSSKGNAGVAATGSSSQISGLKRKVYRVKAKSSELQLMSASNEIVAAPILDATKDGGNDSVADSYKKQKTSSPTSLNRSADQAATAEQCCRTQ
jgi:hypothetical protein